MFFQLLFDFIHRFNKYAILLNIAITFQNLRSDSKHGYHNVHICIWQTFWVADTYLKVEDTVFDFSVSVSLSYTY